MEEVAQGAGRSVEPAVGREHAVGVVVEAGREVRLEARHHLAVGVADPVHPADALQLFPARADDAAQRRGADVQVRDKQREGDRHDRRGQSLGPHDEADDDERGRQERQEHPRPAERLVVGQRSTGGQARVLGVRIDNARGSDSAAAARLGGDGSICALGRGAGSPTVVGSVIVAALLRRRPAGLESRRGAGRSWSGTSRCRSPGRPRGPSPGRRPPRR